MQSESIILRPENTQRWTVITEHARREQSPPLGRCIGSCLQNHISWVSINSENGLFKKGKIMMFWSWRRKEDEVKYFIKGLENLFSWCKFRSLTAITGRMMCLLSNTGGLIERRWSDNQCGRAGEAHFTYQPDTVRCNALEIWLWDRSQRWGFDGMSFPGGLRYEREKGQRKSCVHFSKQILELHVQSKY